MKSSRQFFFRKTILSFEFGWRDLIYQHTGTPIRVYSQESFFLSAQCLATRAKLGIATSLGKQKAWMLFLRNSVGSRQFSVLDSRLSGNGNTYKNCLCMVHQVQTSHSPEAYMSMHNLLLGIAESMFILSKLLRHVEMVKCMDGDHCPRVDVM